MTAKQARAKASLEMPSQLDCAAYRRDIEARWRHRCTCGHDPCRPEYHYSDRTPPGLVATDDQLVVHLAVSFPDPEPPGVGLAEAQARVAAICGLTWAEQQHLTQDLRIELWALVLADDARWALPAAREYQHWVGPRDTGHWETRQHKGDLQPTDRAALERRSDIVGRFRAAHATDIAAFVEARRKEHVL